MRTARFVPLCLLVLALAAAAARGQATYADAFEAAAGAFEATPAAEWENLLATFEDAGAADARLLGRTIGRFDDAFDALRDAAEADAAIEWPGGSLREEPDWYAGVNPLVAVAAAKLTAAGAGGAVDAAALDAHAMRVALRAVSRGPGTRYWFDAVNGDLGLMTRIAARLGDVRPATLDRLAADLPPPRDFAESTGSEGEQLVEILRGSDDLPDWVRSNAEAPDLPPGTLEEWRADWRDAETKRRLIEEYELYFDLEVELADQFEAGDRGRFLESLRDWELGHDAEAMWLARNTLMSPRVAYGLLARHRATAELFDAAIEGVRTGDLRAAAKSAGAEFRRIDDVPVLFRRGVLLSEGEPVILAVE